MNSEKAFFSTDGKGRWWKSEHECQCPETAWFLSRCQGVEGHKGVHWSFSPDGSFCFSDNVNDPSENGCSGTTPPDHKCYRTPLEMAKYHFMKSVTHEVTDPVEIARLESGETKSGESISRPVDFAKLSPELAEKLRDRLKEPILEKTRKPWWAFWRTEKHKIN
jgi:hypothetical protein